MIFLLSQITINQQYFKYHIKKCISKTLVKDKLDITMETFSVTGDL